MQIALEAHAHLHVYEYMGFAVNIPKEFLTGFIAMDETGEVYVYDDTPGVSTDDEMNKIYVPVGNRKCCKVINLKDFMDAQDMFTVQRDSFSELWETSCWPISSLPKLR